LIQRKFFSAGNFFKFVIKFLDPDPDGFLALNAESRSGLDKSESETLASTPTYACAGVLKSQNQHRCSPA
jgi:hypothetical protein